MILKECKRAITSKTALAAYGISLVLLLIGGWDYVIPFPYPITVGGTYLEKYLISLSEGVTSWMTVCFPIVGCIPYALSYRDESDSGFYYLYLLKTNRGQYRLSKIIATFVSGFLAVFGACFTWYLFMIFVIGTGESQFPILYDVNFAESLYDRRPFLYGMVYTLNAGVQSGVFAVVGMGVSAMIKNRYIAVLLPFAYCIFSAAVLDMYCQAFNAITLFDIGQYYGGTLGYWGILIYDVILILIGINLFLVGDYYAHEG